MYITYKGKTERLYVDEGKELREVLDCSSISYQDLLHEVNKFAKKHSLKPSQVDLIEISKMDDEYIALTYCDKKSKEEIEEAKNYAVEKFKARVEADIEYELCRIKKRLEELEKHKLNTICVIQAQAQPVRLTYTITEEKL